MVDKNLFVIGLFVFTAISVGFTIYFKMTTAEKIKSRDKLGRNVKLGTALIFLGLLWCVPVSAPIAPVFLLPYLLPLAVALTVFGYIFLDFHFARGIGGLLILTSSFFLSNVWAYCQPEDSIFAIFFTLQTFILGIIGLFISGKPYLLRDWFRKCISTPKIKAVTIAYFIIYSATCSAVALTLL